jgi:hypothetical protein
VPDGHSLEPDVEPPSTTIAAKSRTNARQRQLLILFICSNQAKGTKSNGEEPIEGRNVLAR